MKPNSYTTADLVANILMVSHMPLGNNTFTAPEILALANRELQTSVMAQILSTRGNYYSDYSDYPISANGLYVIPADCVAGALENIEIVNGVNIIPVNMIMESEQFSVTVPSGGAYGAFFKGNYVNILPSPTTGVIRFWYSKRPSRMVPVSQAAQVTGINGNILSVLSVPSIITSGITVDILGDQPPFNLLSTELITDVTGTDITISNEVEGIQVGDWIALEGQTPVPQLPVEFRPLLEQRVVVMIYETQGALDKKKSAESKLKELEADTFKLITPRVKSKTKVINPSDGGFLGGGRRTFFPTGW